MSDDELLVAVARMHFNLLLCFPRGLYSFQPFRPFLRQRGGREQDCFNAEYTDTHAPRTIVLFSVVTRFVQNVSFSVFKMALQKVPRSNSLLGVVGIEMT